MNISDMPMMNMLRERMSWLNQRQGILSQNVANADTPGYAARDLKAVDFEQTLKDEARQNAGGLMVTNARHIAITPTSESGNFEETETPVSQDTPGGNTVAIEEEMIKVADTQAQYAAATNLYSKAFAMMKTAIGH
jgi:flagellar basal-body rod protein FlgB